MKVLCALAIFCFAGVTYAAAPTALHVEPFAGDKPAHKVEQTKVVQNPDGTTTVSVVLVYEDGSKESCTFVMKVGPAPGNKLLVNPKSRTCSPISERQEQK